MWAWWEPPLCLQLILLSALWSAAAPRDPLPEECYLPEAVDSGDASHESAAPLLAACGRNPIVNPCSSSGGGSGLGAGSSLLEGADHCSRTLRIAAAGGLAEVAAAPLIAGGACRPVVTSCQGGGSGLAAGSSLLEGANDHGCAVWLVVAGGDLAEVAAAWSGCAGLGCAGGRVCTMSKVARPACMSRHHAWSLRTNFP